MKGECEEMEDLINEAADLYRSTEEILAEYNLTLEQALDKAQNFCSRFFDTLVKKGIAASNVSRICLDVVKLIDKDRSDETIFIYTALLTENGLLFGNISDSEQKVRLWLDQSEKMQLLTMLIEKEPEYHIRLSELKKYKPKVFTTEIDGEEQVMLYQMAVENTFLYKSRHSNILLENIGELVRQVNANNVYCQI